MGSLCDWKTLILTHGDILMQKNDIAIMKAKSIHKLRASPRDEEAIKFLIRTSEKCSIARMRINIG